MILPSRRSASLAVPATLVPSRRWGGIRPNRPSVRGSRLARLARPAPRVDADVPARVYPLPIHHRPLIQFAEQLPLLNLVKLINVSLLHSLNLRCCLFVAGAGVEPAPEQPASPSRFDHGLQPRFGVYTANRPPRAVVDHVGVVQHDVVCVSLSD